MSNKDVNKREASAYVEEFYQTSWNWRSQGYHARWDKWENNLRSIYDPEIKALKESWQATMFDPITVTNVEVIAAAVTKILMSKKNSMGIEPRETGDQLQAELNTALLNHQIDKSDFVLAFNLALKQALTYGSGFLKFYWWRKQEKRRLRERVETNFIKRLFKADNAMGVYRDKVVEIMAKDQVRVEMVPIRDIFPAPNALDLARVIHRTRVSYGELVDMSGKKNDRGDYLIDPEAVRELETVEEGDNFETEVLPSKSEINLTDPAVPRTKYGKMHTVKEFWGEIPRRWTEPDMDPDRKASHELVPGKVLTANGRYLACEENPMQSMEPPFLKIDYIPTWETYGIGVCQLLEGIQDEMNEIRNQRVDNVSLSMNKMFVVIEKYLVDPKELRSKPGAIFRLKGSDIDDVRKVFSEIPISDAALSAFKETFELERKAQEVTGANRVTIGSAGTVKDANQTLGGMELLRQAAADRFTVYAYLIGRMSLVKAAKKYMELIYQNMPDDMIRRILGDRPVTMMDEYGEDIHIARWQAFNKIPPHELEMDYDFVPVDVFNEENLMAKDQAMGSYVQLLASILPQFDPTPAFRMMGRNKGLTNDEIDQIMSGVSGPIPTPMAMGSGIPSVAKSSPGGAGKSSMTPSPLESNPLVQNGVAAS